MQDPKALAEAALKLAGGDAEATADLESRAQQGRLSFAATMYAIKSGCDCGACQLLRKATDALTADTFKEVGIDAPGHNPQSGSSPPVS